MKLVWHHIKKDLRSHKYLLSAWLLILAAKPMAAIYSPEMLSLFVYLPALLGIGLIAALVQEDALVGSEAFWMTRPLRNHRLFLAKSILVTLLAACWLASDMVTFGVMLDWHQTGPLTLHFITYWLPGIVLAFALSALTRSIVQMIFVSAFVLTGALLYNLFEIVARYFQQGFTDFQFLAGRQVSARLAAFWLAGIGAAVVVWLQYRTRCVARCLSILALVMVTAMAVSVFWRWDFLTPSLPADLPVRLSSLQYDLKNDKAYISDLSEKINQGKATKYKQYFKYYTTQAKDCPYFLVPTFLTGELHYEDQRTFKMSKGGFGLEMPSGQIERRHTMASVLPGMKVLNARDSHLQDRAICLIRVPEAEYEKYKDLPGHYRGRLRYHVFKWSLAGELPLSIGAQWKTNGISVRVEDLESIYATKIQNGLESKLLDGFQVGLSEYIALWDFGVQRSAWVQEKWIDQYTMAPMLLNKQLKELLLSSRSGGSMFYPSMNLQHRTRQYSIYGTVFTNEIKGLDKDWLTSATLVLLMCDFLGDYEQEIEIDRLILNPIPKTR